MPTKYRPRPDRAELLAEADRIRTMSAGPLQDKDSVSLLREDRERRPVAVEAPDRSPRRRPNATL